MNSLLCLVTGYEIRYTRDSRLSTSSWQMKSVSADSREQVITGLSPNTQYYFMIRSVSADSAGAYSQQIKVRTAAGGVVPPSVEVVPPAGFSATVEGSRVRLTWRGSTSPGVTGMQGIVSS